MLIFGLIMIAFGGLLYHRGKAPQKHRDAPHTMSAALRITGLALIVLGIIFLILAGLFIGMTYV